MIQLRQTSYQLNNATITNNSSIKDLEITISNDLSWTPHYKSIIAKAYKSQGLIRHTFTTNSADAKRCLYISLVCSHLPDSTGSNINCEVD